ncbi:alpha-galactosidase [Actinoplanes lobatus]|uniref:alpha-galactosidase n=1 Tax=Actinoplanes lobatus TaxID=113568 RepID=A0A7W7H982_9ACTN|nr:alpha-galactosidase [Actinoplanes lobatus]MBB4746198.1 alpha-galactosidase [Actinoplanes lobatus]GGN61335.1 alpha-galactosidase [Actinoplanes lobatus]GIE41406.1 alpha-galactosidase [Actinoplanes lobatus]
MTVFHLRAAGVSLVLDTRGTAARILHWGPGLGDHLPAGDAFVPAVPPSSIDVPLRLSLLPSLAEGWTGRPALSAGPLRLIDAHASENTAFVRHSSPDSTQEVSTELEMSAEGVLRLRHRLTNRGDAELTVPGLDMLLPIPDSAAELLDFTGLWSHERQPQRAPLRHGVWSRESRHGRPGHDDAFLMIAGEPGFGFRAGRVWAVHLAWSGDKRIWAERSALGYGVLGAGELLSPGEIRLAPGESYETPWLVAVFSDAGLDGLSDRLHPWIRAHSPARLPRPVVLNTWEAVYFDHDLGVLSDLVDAAALVGVERFVLDDGWFAGRRDDRRALGDWFVDAEVWPDGLHPLIARVEKAGMDFGLWVEPEMISPDSALAAAHPDWILDGGTGPTWRWQRVLDLTKAHDYLLDRLSELLTEYPIAFLKWDHNRDLLTPHSGRQTRALYRLLTSLRARFPHVEIESCASGGARIDLGILELVDRFWTSDTNDPLDRQSIQRWTGVLIPPEYLGGHLGAATAHVTGRTSALGLRLATALFGSAGIEWNLTAANASERERIAAWIAEHKRLRPLLHTGRVVRADSPDPAHLLHGVVAQDRTHAVFALVTLGAPRAALPPPIRLPGLDPDRLYTVRPIGVPPRTLQDAPPPWLAAGSATVTGRFLAEVGLPAPLLTPEQALLIEVSRH